MNTGRQLNLDPKAEDRRSKEIRNPKAESGGDGFVLDRGDLRISNFGLLSGFGLRPWDFSTRAHSPKRTVDGFMLTEALVYIGLVFVLLGIGYAAMYRCIDNSVALRRNADDIAGALHAGERWRADIRLASDSVRWDTSAEPVLRLDGGTNRIEYRLSSGALYRRTGAGPWSKLLDRVASSLMEREVRPNVTVWRWELELQPKASGSFKPGRIRPLFTFLGIPPAVSSP
jgi:hypothetical protein